jgi:hypothetical protein
MQRIGNLSDQLRDAKLAGSTTQDMDDLMKIIKVCRARDSCVGFAAFLLDHPEYLLICPKDLSVVFGDDRSIAFFCPVVLWPLCMITPHASLYVCLHVCTLSVRSLVLLCPFNDFFIEASLQLAIVLSSMVCCTPASRFSRKLLLSSMSANNSKARYAPHTSSTSSSVNTSSFKTILSMNKSKPIGNG